MILTKFQVFFPAHGANQKGFKKEVMAIFHHILRHLPK